MQMTLKNLEHLKSMIETLHPNHQVEILRILHKHGVKLNSSKSGICVNLTPLSTEILEELKQKVDFILVREQTLNEFEKQTEKYKTMTTSLSNEKEDKEKMLEFPTRV
jgi:galactitol-specific phosphotransferase system IIB component